MGPVGGDLGAELAAESRAHVGAVGRPRGVHRPAAQHVLREDVRGGEVTLRPGHERPARAIGDEYRKAVSRGARRPRDRRDGDAIRWPRGIDRLDRAALHHVLCIDAAHPGGGVPEVRPSHDHAPGAIRDSRRVVLDIRGVVHQQRGVGGGGQRGWVRGACRARARSRLLRCCRRRRSAQGVVDRDPHLVVGESRRRQHCAGDQPEQDDSCDGRDAYERCAQEAVAAWTIHGWSLLPLGRVG